MSSETVSILVINPNSSRIITDGLKRNLAPCIPPGTKVTYFTGPSDAPPSINDEHTSQQSEQACLRLLEDSSSFSKFDGFLVCCFSDHPLTYSLRKLYNKPVLNIFHASLIQGLLLGSRIGIITTGPDWIEPLTKGAVDFFGGNGRFVGVEATGLGVVELKTDGEGQVEEQVRKSASEMANKGAAVIVLGCAGMAGMERMVKSAVQSAGLPPVEVVDGAKAGIELLSGLARKAG
ncbi:hypothetical protein OE88DRAFT_1714467 [Heliocybe sulcata]|uniref:Asp/Glu/hydantoin racemase n=1 Tax=Heliocybe sulcata TaxID=5364 RepID=A0A5C3MRN3_9AGAM|nr:hypothetical protein OE88DRAFT_1714467 [Heliocybe sulcata]